MHTVYLLAVRLADASERRLARLRHTIGLLSHDNVDVTGEAGGLVNLFFSTDFEEEMVSMAAANALLADDSFMLLEVNDCVKARGFDEADTWIEQHAVRRAEGARTRARSRKTEQTNVDFQI